jgi:hypothetical protein
MCDQTHSALGVIKRGLNLIDKFAVMGINPYNRHFGSPTMDRLAWRKVAWLDGPQWPLGGKQIWTFDQMCDPMRWLSQAD